MIEFFLNWLLEPIVYLVAGIWGAEEPTNARWAVGCLLFLLLAFGIGCLVYALW